MKNMSTMKDRWKPLLWFLLKLISVGLPTILILIYSQYSGHGLLRQEVSFERKSHNQIFKSYTRFTVQLTNSKGCKPKTATPVYPAGLPLPYFHSHLPNAYLYPTNDTIYKDSVAGFVHIPKSGGTTIKECMVSMLPETEPAVLMSFKTAATTRQDLLNRVADQRRYYMGDSTLGICDYGTLRPCSYFTMLREPYHRVISHYYFCKDGGESYPPCNNTLEEFALNSCSLFFRQHTVRFNCQREIGHKTETCPENVTCSPLPWLCNATELHVDNLGITEEQRRNVLKYVVDNLDKTFGVIGFTEEFETSLKLFQDVYGLPFYDQCNGVHHNAGTYSHREDRNRTTEEEIEYAKERLRKNPDVRRCMEDDLKIYERAKEIFQLQKRKYELKL